MDEWIVTIKRKAGRRQRRIIVYVCAAQRWAAINIARRIYYTTGKARIEARRVST